MSDSKEELKLKRQLHTRYQQSGKTHVMVGKRKLVELPSNILVTLHDKFIIDESSKTGLRWSYSNSNRSNLRGKEAGKGIGNRGYYFIGIIINSTLYRLNVSRIVVMMFNNKIIETGMCVNHKNRERNDNRIDNLEVTTVSLNNINTPSKGFCFYKNVCICRSRAIHKFHAQFKFLGFIYRSKQAVSEDAALLLGWELITSGRIPIAAIKAQSDEWKDGTYLQRALAECAKQGIAVTPPKFKTLYEYIASVEGS